MPALNIPQQSHTIPRHPPPSYTITHHQHPKNVFMSISASHLHGQRRAMRDISAQQDLRDGGSLEGFFSHNTHTLTHI